MELARQPDRVAAVPRFADHGQLRIVLEELAQSLAKDRMVIGDQNGNGAGPGSRVPRSSDVCGRARHGYSPREQITEAYGRRMQVDIAPA